MFDATTLQNHGFQAVNDPSDTAIAFRKTTCVEDLPYAHMHMEDDVPGLHGTALAYTEVLKDGSGRLRIPSAAYFESYPDGEEAIALINDAMKATPSWTVDLLVQESLMAA